MCIILSSDQSRKSDQIAEQENGLSPRILVENAGRSSATYLIERAIVRRSDSIAVLIGSGFNGADGIVIAKVLIGAGFNTKIFRVKKSKNDTINDLLKNSLEIIGGIFSDLENYNEFSDELESTDVLIDCITGNGFSGEIEKKFVELIELVNTRKFSNKLKVISIDIPSFNSPDLIGKSFGLKADVTLALQTLKNIHVEPSHVETVGKVVLIDVGIPIRDEISNFKVFDLEQARKIDSNNIKESRFIHKGNRSKVLVVGGSKEKEGAAVIAARGALRTGAGLVTIASTSSAMRAIAQPEIMVHRIDLKSRFSEFESLIKESDSVVIGPGLGVGNSSRAIFETILEFCNQVEKKLIIDADAIKFFAEFYLNVSDRIKSQIVLTPHPKEFLNLTKEKNVEAVLKNRSCCLKEAVQKYGTTVVLKGARSLVATGSQVSIMPHIEPILAVGGSGDLLSGVIAALLPKFDEIRDGVSLAVFVHGQAGYCASKKLQRETGVFASEIGNFIPDALKSIEQSSSEASLFREPFNYSA